MAISGSGGWIPAARVFIYRRQMRMQYPFHNVPPEVIWHPEDAAAWFVDCAADRRKQCGIYVPLAKWGGTGYLCELLVELDLIDPLRELA